MTWIAALVDKIITRNDQRPISQTFMSSWLKSYENSLCCSYDSENSIRSEICTCHNSSAAIACTKFWADLIIIIHVRAKHIFARFESWAQKYFVKWDPGCCWFKWHSYADRWDNSMRVCNIGFTFVMLNPLPPTTPKKTKELNKTK